MRRKFFRRMNPPVSVRSQGLFKLNVIFIFISLLFLIIGTVLLINSDFLKIKSVALILDEISCSDSDQLKNSANLLGQNILFINPSKTENIIKSKFICVKGVSVSRGFPDKVKMFVWRRVPVAIIFPWIGSEATASSSLETIATPSAQPSAEFFLADIEGVIFSKGGEKGSLPSIFISNLDLSLGLVLDNKTKEGLEILEKVKVLGIEAQRVLVSDDFLIIFSSPRIIFRLGEKLGIQLASLQLILEKAKIDDVRLEFIDLRFDKPAVKIAPKKT